MSFFKYYFGLEEGVSEQRVLCPFPHTTNGIAYQESHPSAHVNIDKGLFHCKSCGRGSNELHFIKELYGITFSKALKVHEAFLSDGDILDWKQARQLSDDAKGLLTRLHISEETAEELLIAGVTDTAIMYPVLMHDKVVDIRTYRPAEDPKLLSNAGSTVGYIIPYDIWRNTTKSRFTIICAGEKDMSIARSLGFNAITITGGESTLPITSDDFIDTRVAIIYDNDDAGKMGAVKLASHLLSYTKDIRIVTGLYDTCTERGEDLHDYFTKYNKTASDLIQLIQATPIVSEDELHIESELPLVSLREASRANNINRLLRANIQVVATMEDVFHAPTEVSFTKRKPDGKSDQLYIGQVKTWELTTENVGDVLHLIDNNFKEIDVFKNLRNLAYIPAKEGGLSRKVHGKATIFKCTVIDMFESSSDDVAPMEFTVYSKDVKLESGRKYEVEFTMVPHPYKGQKLTMLVSSAKDANDSVTSFVVDNDTVAHLEQFVRIEGTVEQKVSQLTERVKGLLGYDGNNQLIETIDLSFHTPLQFNMGTFKEERAYLDTIIVGESRVGKSSTADALRKTYGLGTFTSLAGNSATVPGLIGGSHKTANGNQTRAGLIPQNHKGLVIFEEFGKCNANIVKELTDIRSSNEVRISRVSGSIALPAMVRMIALTNVKSHAGEIKSIASYPNGIEVITELVGTAEDIARYDLMAVLSDRGNSITDPFWVPQQPLPDEVYRTRIRWIWSRTAEQIQITEVVGRYIIEQANALNQVYDSHIKIFGTEAWKKLARVAIAVAGYVVSTDAAYQSIIVDKEHVDYAVQFLIKLYDNSTFRLKEYVEHQRKYSTIDDDGVTALQRVYEQAPALLQHLEASSKTSRNNLIAAAGMTNDTYNLTMTKLVQGMFVRYHGSDILPSERFRLGMQRINRNIRVPQIGDLR